MPNSFDAIQQAHDNAVGYYGRLDTATKKFQRGKKSGSIIKDAKENLFEFPVFVSNSIPIDLATSANELLCQLYMAYVTMAVSTEPLISKNVAENHAQFARWKTDTNKYLEYASLLDMDYLKEAAHAEYVYEGYTATFDLLNMDDRTAKLVNEAVDYQPLSEFDFFFQEATTDDEQSKSVTTPNYAIYINEKLYTGNSKKEIIDAINGREEIKNPEYVEGATGDDIEAKKTIMFDKNNPWHQSIVNNMIYDNGSTKKDYKTKNDIDKLDEELKKVQAENKSRIELDNWAKSSNAKSLRKELGIKNSQDLTFSTLQNILNAHKGAEDSRRIAADELLKKAQTEEINRKAKTWDKTRETNIRKGDESKALNETEKREAQTALKEAISKAAVDYKADPEKYKNNPKHALAKELTELTGLDIISSKDVDTCLAALEMQDILRETHMNELKEKQLIQQTDVEDFENRKAITAAQRRDWENKTTKNMLRLAKAKEVFQTTNAGIQAVRSALGVVSDVQGIRQKSIDIKKAKEDLELKKKQNRDYEEDKKLDRAEKTQKIKSAQEITTAKITDETKLQKLNTMKPYTMSVQFGVMADDGTITKMNYMCGVKTHCRIIDADILPEVAQYPLKEMDNLSRKAKWRAGELKFLKDLVFNIKGKKQSAVDARDPKRKWYRRLYTLAHMKGDAAAAEVVKGKSLFTAYFKDKIGKSDMSRGVIPNVSMIVSQSDIDNIKARTGIDLGKGSKAKNFCNELFLMCFMIIDTDAESFKYIIPDLHNDFEVHSMASVNKMMATLDTAGTKTKDLFKLLG